MSEICFLTAHPRDAATGLVETVRLAGGGSDAAYYRDGAHYRAGLVAMPRFRAAFGFDDNGWTGGTVPTSGEMAFAPSTRALLDELAAYYWRDAQIIIDSGDERGPLTRRLTGTVADAAIEDGRLVLKLADPSQALDKPILGAGFSGEGGVEGPVEAAGRPKRRSFGLVFNIEGALLDKANNIYEFGDPSQPLHRFDAVRDKGRAGELVELGWQGSVEDTFAVLKAAEAPRGGCVAAPSIACVKWWTVPAGPLTADVRGEAAGGYSEVAATIAARLLSLVDGPTIMNQAEAEALRPATCGVHIAGPNDTVAQAIDRLLLGLSLYWVLNPDGTVRIGEWSWTVPAEALQAQFIGRERHLPPVKSRAVGYRRNHRQHQPSEISAAVIAADDVTYLNGESLESLKPAEPGATDGATVGGNVKDGDGNVIPREEIITSEGTAKDTQSVGGRASLAILEDVDKSKRDIDEIFSGHGTIGEAVGEAQAAKDDAVAAANAADGHAQVATSSRNEAEGFSRAAQGEAVTAGEAAQVATAKAAAASDSESSAAESASLSAQYRDGAQRAALAARPTTFEDGANFFKGDASYAAPNNMVHGVDPDHGPYFEVSNSGAYGTVAWKAREPNIIGKKWKVRALVSHNGGTPATAQLRLEYWDGATGGTRITVSSSNRPAITSSTPVWIEAVIAGLDYPFASPAIVTNYPGQHQAKQRVYALELIDIDVAEDAKTQANIAGESAATATAEAAVATDAKNLTVQYRDASQKAATATMPSTFEDGSLYYGGNNGSPTPGNMTPNVHATHGPNLTNTNSSTWGSVGTKARLPTKAGQRWKVRALIGHGAGTAAKATLSLERWPSATGGTRIDALVAYFNVQSTTPTWCEHIFTAAGDGFVCPVALLNYPAPSTAFQRIYALELIDVEAVEAAASQAGIATSQAAIATAEAAAAKQSAILSASIGQGALNLNPAFADWPNASGLPVSWDIGVPDIVTRAPGRTSPYAADLTGPAGQNSVWMKQNVGSPTVRSVKQGDWIAVEADIELVSGSTSGAGAHISVRSSTGSAVQEIPIPLSASTAVGQTHYLRKLVQVTAADAFYLTLYACGHLSYLGTIAAANKTRHHRCAVRPATAAEIRDQEVLAPMEATVAVHAGAIADMEGAAAFHETIVEAEGGKPALMRLKAGKDGTQADLASQRVIVYNPDDAGDYKEVARFENGQARLNDALIRRLQVLPRNDAEIYFPVQLNPKTYLGEDGQVIQYEGGKTLGAVPDRIQPDLTGISVASGEALDVRAINVTPTQFTVRAKKIVAGAATTQNSGAGANVGGTPQWRAHKPTALDASNGYYEFHFTGTIDLVGGEPMGGSGWYGEYRGEFTVYVNTGSGWVAVKTFEVWHTDQFSNFPPNKHNINSGVAVQYSNSIGQHGGHEFGIHPGTGGAVTALTNVRYTIQSTSSETALPQAIPFYVYPSRG